MYLDERKLATFIFQPSKYDAYHVSCRNKSSNLNLVVSWKFIILCYILDPVVKIVQLFTMENILA